MKITTLLVATMLAALPVFGASQGSLKNRLKVHPRRLAFNNKDGRHQPRIQGRKDRHSTRKGVRAVTHKLTQPHHPKGH